jgi:hypothetical protein
MGDDRGAFHYKKKWDVEKAVKKLSHRVDFATGLEKYEIQDCWRTIYAYIGMLELELKSYHRKEDNGICI